MRVGIVTGRASGIGRGIAAPLLAEGWNVVVLDIDGAADAVTRMLNDGDRLDPSWKAMLDQAVGLIPAGRAATVDEVAATGSFLALRNASFITGEVISVNGGSSML